MAASRRNPRKKSRITEEKITDMKRLYREGMTISAIAKKLDVHRQTVTAYIAEKHQDIVADEVRKQLLGEELRNHFNQLVVFIQRDIRRRFNASPASGLQVQGTINTAGSLGLPYPDAPHVITSEWSRMYNPTAREQHLLASLRRHTRDSKLWILWDRWHKKVDSFEKTSRLLWDWLGDQIETTPPDDIGSAEKVRSWVFGNLIRIGVGKDPNVIETLTQAANGNELSPVANSQIPPLSMYALKMLEKARSWREYDMFKSSIVELAASSTQAELKSLARDIDFVLAGLELMNAFPGHCELCPV